MRTAVAPIPFAGSSHEEGRHKCTLVNIAAALRATPSQSTAWSVRAR